MRTSFAHALSLLPAVATGAIWFVAASRFMYRFGPNEAAVAVGLAGAVRARNTIMIEPS